MENGRLLSTTTTIPFEGSFDEYKAYQLQLEKDGMSKLKKEWARKGVVRDKEFNKLNTTKVSGLDSFLKELVVPTTFIKGLFGSKQPVNMESYPVDAQDFLRYIVRNNKEGPVSWKQWAKHAENYQVERSGGKLKDNTVGHNQLNFNRPVSDQLFHPMNQVHNTLGQFNIGIDPKTTEYIINDSYNFEKNDTVEGGISPGSKWWDPRFPLAKLGNLVIPEAKAFSINTGVFQNEDSYYAVDGRTAQHKQ
jgi:hypothetical protein